jgi:hypothetical protein
MSLYINENSIAVIKFKKGIKKHILRLLIVIKGKNKCINHSKVYISDNKVVDQLNDIRIRSI